MLDTRGRDKIRTTAAFANAELSFETSVSF